MVAEVGDGVHGWAGWSVVGVGERPEWWELLSRGEEAGDGQRRRRDAPTAGEREREQEGGLSDSGKSFEAHVSCELHARPEIKGLGR